MSRAGILVLILPVPVIALLILFTTVYKTNENKFDLAIVHVNSGSLCILETLQLESHMLHDKL